MEAGKTWRASYREVFVSRSEKDGLSCHTKGDFDFIGIKESERKDINKVML